jgi:uncharacterized SAM-binding protein YcdF (DUF218 family)
MRWWEVKSLPADSVKKVYTYAVVLGGMSDQDKRNGKLVIERSIDRIIQAVILYNQGKVKKIIVTGGSGELLNQGQKESMLIKDFCIKLGVRDSDILIETESRNTYENAIFTKRLIPYEKEKVLLITSAFHMRRSAAVFAKAGYKFDTLATDPFVTRPAIDDYFLPNARALVGWQTLLKEMVGYLVYGLVGYL